MKCSAKFEEKYFVLRSLRDLSTPNQSSVNGSPISAVDYLPIVSLLIVLFVVTIFVGNYKDGEANGKGISRTVGAIRSFSHEGMTHCTFLSMIRSLA